MHRPSLYVVYGLSPLACHSLQKNTFPPFFSFGLFHIEADPARRVDDDDCVYDARYSSCARLLGSGHQFLDTGSDSLLP